MSGITQVSRNQKGKTNLDFTEAETVSVICVSQWSVGRHRVDRAARGVPVLGQLDVELEAPEADHASYEQLSVRRENRVLDSTSASASSCPTPSRVCLCS